MHGKKQNSYSEAIVFSACSTSPVLCRYSNRLQLQSNTARDSGKMYSEYEEKTPAKIFLKRFRIYKVVTTAKLMKY